MTMAMTELRSMKDVAQFMGKLVFVMSTDPYIRMNAHYVYGYLDASMSSWSGGFDAPELRRFLDPSEIDGACCIYANGVCLTTEVRELRTTSMREIIPDEKVFLVQELSAKRLCIQHCPETNIIAELLDCSIPQLSYN